MQLSPSQCCYFFIVFFLTFLSIIVIFDVISGYGCYQSHFCESWYYFYIVHTYSYGWLVLSSCYDSNCKQSPLCLIISLSKSGKFCNLLQSFNYSFYAFYLLVYKSLREQLLLYAKKSDGYCSRVPLGDNHLHFWCLWGWVRGLSYYFKKVVTKFY